MNKHLTIALIGEPNAGKSSLLNTIIGVDIAIVTSKVQTTRKNLRGIHYENNTEMVFVDTPGLFEPHGKLERFIVKNAKQSFAEVDLIAVLYDPKRINNYVVELLADVKKPKIALINKVDAYAKEDLLPLAQKLSDFGCFAEIFFISAKDGTNVDMLIDYLATQAKEMPWMYNEEMLSDTPVQQLAEEITREQAYQLLNKEIPYALKVETVAWQPGEDGVLEVHQEIIVMKESQKKIIIGAKGEKLKEIGKRARYKIKALLEAPLRLFLHVKVRADWIDRDFRDL